jgi:hydroxyacylglutathione hydrolase
MSLEITQLKAFSDNYIYVLKCTKTGVTAVVDPGDADVVKNHIGEGELHYILNTHHHEDHIGGNEALKAKYRCQVVAYESDIARIETVDMPIKAWDKIRIGKSEAVVIPTPAHTTGHIAYHFVSDDALFCGDTLFAGGCGRLFEGTAEDLFNTFKRFKELSLKTRIYCAHEYTVDNFKFAVETSPEPRYKKALEWAEDVRNKGISTVPTTLEEELNHNIFLRADNIRELSALRLLKDNS